MVHVTLLTVAEKYNRFKDAFFYHLVLDVLCPS